MNTKNLEFLKDSLKYLGFGDKLNAELEKNIDQQPDKFQLKTIGEFKQGDRKEQVDYSLDFKKSEKTDMYFFNGYKATLKNEDPEKEKSQYFYINVNSGVTAKEAFNLLSGRAVHKELMNADKNKFQAWLQLDFTQKDKHDNFKINQYHSGYGYDLAQTLTNYPIKELTSLEDTEKMLKSLEKGNVHKVTFLSDGNEQPMFIEANPKYKTLTVYDAQMKKIFQSADREQKTTADMAKEKKETLKVEQDDDDPSRKQKKKRGMRV